MPENKLSYYINQANKLEIGKFEKKLKIAILGSFTLNGLAETLSVKCSEYKVGAQTFVSGYNQYNQDILDPKSKLYEFSPDITFLLLDTRSLLGDYFFSPYSISGPQRRQFIEQKFNEIKSIITSFKQNSRSKFIISNYSIPTYSSYGISEFKTDYGLHEMMLDLNSKLIQLLRDDSSVYLYDYNGFTARFGESNIFDYSKFLYGDVKVSFDYMPHLANDLMGYVKPFLGLNRKCIVLDLDNTLWGGVVGEEGFEGIQLGPTAPGNAYVEFQRQLLALHQRGIILAINSKNNPDDALQVIRQHPHMILQEEHFACFKINWGDKVANMKSIAAEVNIGLDSMVFFDDDSMNREYMRLNLPQVLTVDIPKDSSQYAKTLMDLNDFNVLQITDEDLKRGKMYFQDRQRTELEKANPNLNDFLKQLHIKLNVKNADKFTIPRISQLTLKTNQFNLTTQRYQEEDIKKFAENKNMLVKCVQVEDKFGDNGITGVVIVKKDNQTEWSIDTLLLSCRVMGRGVEEGILGHILNLAINEGVKKVKGVYIPTKKNKPCENFLSSYGFVKENDQWVYSLDKAPKIPEHLDVGAS